LAVYIEGVRLLEGSGVDQWQPDAIVETRLTLGKSYPAGTELYAVQNEPSGSAPAPLERSKNLADLQDVPTARANLGVYSKAEADQKAPAGMVAHFARQTAPSGWLKANGAAVSRAAYATLFSAIGTTFGNGDGFNTFNLPDLRGEFLRGWDDGRGVDGGRGFGSWQADELRSHNHSLYGNDRGTNSGQKLAPGLYRDDAEDYVGAADERTIRHTGGNETRPRNRALLACIKY
ncbi:phage tail protein, partial [Halomonas sp. PAR7]